LGTVIGSYKSGVTRRAREALGASDLMVWQGRYHDHIIRNEDALNAIRQYIQNNVALWQQDTFFA
jgi:REP element-mobilizing transposase RayT